MGRKNHQIRYLLLCLVIEINYTVIYAFVEINEFLVSIKVIYLGVGYQIISIIKDHRLYVHLLQLSWTNSSAGGGNRARAPRSNGAISRRCSAAC